MTNLTYREITFLTLLVTNWVTFEKSNPINVNKTKQEVAIIESNQYIQVTVCEFVNHQNFTNKFCLTNNILVQSDIINIDSKDIRDYKPDKYYLTNLSFIIYNLKTNKMD